MQKNGKPGTQASDGRLRGGRRVALRADGVPVPATGTLEFALSDATADERAHPVGHTAARTLAQVSALWLPPDRGEAARGGLPSRPQAGAKAPASRRRGVILHAEVPPPGCRRGEPSRSCRIVEGRCAAIVERQ